ncbi:radical SAM protein [Breoghania sp.]|uniref:radical SAM protein n=1 Tax=Breoghania sp. TaxID=2065378 RepID=UPI002AAB500F|nr:radical SAM protein [Breoghania sp.]
MRVRDQIYVLHGARRAALYDDNSKVCSALDDAQVRILCALAEGRRPRAKDLSLETGQFWKAVADMNQRGWLEAGRPVPRSLLPPVAAANGEFVLPDRFKHVWLELTDSCNLTCMHCYAESGPQRSRAGELSIEQWTGVVDKFLDWGVEQFTFIGGEPTIRMDVIEAVAAHIRSRSQDVTICIFSNLVSVPTLPRVVPKLKQWNIQIGTSLYGASGKEHDTTTGKIGSWVKTVANVRLLLDEGIRVFAGIYTDLSDGADDKKTRLEAWARELGLKHFDVVASSQVGRGTELCWAESNDLNSLPGPMSYGFARWDRAGTYHNCFHDHLAIGARGEVMSCIMQRETDIGDVTEMSVEDIISTSSFKQKAYLGKDNIETCSQCEFRYACFDCRPSAIGPDGHAHAKPDCGYDPLRDLGEALQ